MATSDDKMHVIAKRLGEINKHGKVKRFGGNERGYAKVLDIRPGCTIFVHHLPNDDLIIDLAITSTAEKRYEDDCNLALSKFKRFFEGRLVKKGGWEHTIEGYKGTRHYVDITNMTGTEILKILNDLKSKWESL